MASVLLKKNTLAVKLFIYGRTLTLNCIGCTVVVGVLLEYCWTLRSSNGDISHVGRIIDSVSLCYPHNLSVNRLSKRCKTKKQMRNNSFLLWGVLVNS